MRALSVKQPWAELIARGAKKVEYRSWKTTPGPILIVASASRQDERCDDEGIDPATVVYGASVCVVDVTSITGDEGNYRWHLKDPKRVQPVRLRGHAAIYHVDDAHILPFDGTAPPSPAARKKRSLPPPLAADLPPRQHGRFEARTSGRPPLPHQALAVRAFAEWMAAEKGGHTGYLEMPTGSGKTFTAVTALRPLFVRGASVLWIAHNAYLLDQARRAMTASLGDAFDARVGTLSGRGKRFDTPVTLATVQTLAGNDLEHLVRLASENRPAVAVFDEFHRSAARTWKHVVTWLQQSQIPVLGLSATPTRTGEEDREWLQKMFPKPVFRVGMTELIDYGVLARPQVFRTEVRGKKKIRWTAEELAHLRRFKDVPESVLQRLAKQESRNKLILETLANGKEELGQSIVFCCSVDHAAHLAGQFEKRGIPAVAVTGAATDPANAESLERFKRGEVRVLTSVVLLTEGVDLPTCDTVLLARPTRSEILLKQMIGRAMRGPKTGGSARCNVFDFVDAFSNANDVSATSRPFMQQYDLSLAPILGAPPNGNQRNGADLAALLRMRDWLAERPGDVDVRAMFLEEVDGILEFFDRTTNVNRAVLVPSGAKLKLQAALREIAQRMRSQPSIAEDPIATAALTREVYAEMLAGSGLSEEDCVSVVAEGSRQNRIVRRTAREIVDSLRESPVFNEEVVKRIEGVERVASLFD